MPVDDQPMTPTATTIVVQEQSLVTASSLFASQVDDEVRRRTAAETTL